MRNSALARVFAVVLAVMCVIMLLSGVYGCRKAVAEHGESLAFAQRLTERIAAFRELDEKLVNTVSYDEALAELEELQEQHDGDASQHRTDLAVYSATKGGYTMGMNLIEYNKGVIADNKLKIDIGQAQLQQKKTQLASGRAQYEAGKAAFLQNRPNDATIAGMEAQLAQLQIYEGQASGALTAESAAAAAATTLANTSRPSGTRPDPSRPATDEDDPDPASVAAWAQYNLDMAAQAAWDQQEAAWQAASDAKDAADVAYTAALGNCDTAAWAAAGVASGASLQEAQATLSAAAAQISGPLATIRGTEAQLAATEAQLVAGEAGIATAEAELASYETLMKQAESALQAELENLWYKMSELEKDAEELGEEKDRLDLESDKLGKMLVSVEEKKELEDKHRSTRVLLTNIDEIKAMVDAGGGVAESAETYLAQSSAEGERLYKGRLLICALALVCGVTGFAGIPGAFEKTKKRFWLLAPVILCLLCACACDGINMYLGLGQMYAALFTAIFALIQLMVILPKNKPLPKAAEE